MSSIMYVCGWRDIQCFLWDCERVAFSAQYCSDDHQNLSLADQNISQAITLVDGIEDNNRLLISDKCLRILHLDFPCGIPLLPREVLNTSPTNQPATFNRNFQPDEAHRTWVFISDAKFDQEMNLVWNHQRTDHLNNGKVRFWIIYKRVTRSSYELFQYSKPECKYAIFWIMYKPRTPGFPEEFDKPSSHHGLLAAGKDHTYDGDQPSSSASNVYEERKYKCTEAKGGFVSNKYKSTKTCLGNLDTPQVQQSFS